MLKPKLLAKGDISHMEIEENVDVLFNKKYQFKFNLENTQLPSVENLFASEPWNDPPLIILKNQMNEQKSRLNDYKLDDWHEHTYNTNHAKLIPREVRRRCFPELLTNAWTKFFEIVSSYQIIPENENTINSVHLCEAPGAFITSLNHYLKTMYRGINFNWMGSSLNPYYEGNSSSAMINDDRFIRYTLDNWYFGEDFTGNIMDWDNSQSIIEKSKKMEKIHLVTADGSIDCSLTPDEQESKVSCLHFCEIVTALQILTEGGSFVVKFFTIYEHSSINLIYLLCACFKSVNCFKPVTSRPGNSEIYLVCVGYGGINIIAPYISKLKKFFDPENFKVKSIFPYSVVQNEFLEDVHAASKHFYNFQYNEIGNNILSYNINDPYLKARLQFLQNNVKERFFEVYQLKQKKKTDSIIMPSIRSGSSNNLFFKKRQNNVSFNDITKPDCNAMDSELITINKEFGTIDDEYGKILPFEIHIRDLISVTKLYLTFGKPIKKVISSLFVDPILLNIYNKLSEINKKEHLYSLVHTHKKKIDSYTINCATFNLSNDYSKWEKTFINVVRSVIVKMKINENMHIENSKFITQYSVGILYIIAKGFFRIVFNEFDRITLCDLRDKEAILSNFDKILNSNLSVSHKERFTLLTVLQLDILYQEQFSKAVFNFNSNNFYKHISTNL